MCLDLLKSPLNITLAQNEWAEGNRWIGDGQNSNSKTLILKDSSVRSIWTCLTASPCYAKNTNKHVNTTDIITNKQLINAISQSSYKYAETSALNFFHGHICIQYSIVLANVRLKHIRPNWTKSYSQRCIYADYV